MLSELIRTTREMCLDALAGPEFVSLKEEVRRARLRDQHILSLARHVWETGDYPKALRLQLAAIREASGEPGAYPLERYLLLSTSLSALERLPRAPVDSTVRKLVCNEIQFVANPSPEWLFHFEPGTNRFKAYCGTALLRLFPAGQFSWQTDGLPRSWLYRVPSRSIPKLLYKTFFQLKGFRPCAVTHFSVLRTKLPLLLENAARKSYHRLARSLRLQPDVRGLITASWLLSERTYAVAPHLSWMARLVVENGGFVGDIGESDPGAGFQEGSVLRKKLYERGEFHPREAMALWPRKAMLDWADRNPELADE